MSTSSEQLHLYWATGCTSCLRAKEFLERKGVDFISHNVMEDSSEFDKLSELGIPEQYPIVRRGEDWVMAVDLSDVASIANVSAEVEILPVDELYSRLLDFLDATNRFVSQIPKNELTTNIPNRPRSYADLIFHIYSIPDAFISHEVGLELRYPESPSWNHESIIALETYGAIVNQRLRDWYNGPGQETDWSETVHIHYGSPTRHAFFERTTWHTGQHTRQLEWIIENKLDRSVSSPLDKDLIDGLPMPEKVWDETPQ